MRVVAGAWGGRWIAAPRGRETRPTPERVREAVFSAIDARIGALDGMGVFDLYAGSGALGIEALSRGAAHVTFIDSAVDAVRTIRLNLERLAVPAQRYEVLPAAVERLNPRRLASRPATLLLADPPYRIDATRVIQVLETLGAGRALTPGALIVYEHAATVQVRWPEGFRASGERRYGDTAVSYAMYES